jgi:hypothetical protein
VTNIVCKPKYVSLSLSAMSFCQETYIDCVLTEETFLPRAPSAFQQANHRAFATFILLSRAAILGYEED